MPAIKKNKALKIRQRWVGLRIKLASFTILLVIIVVLMVSIPLYIMMMQAQNKTLKKSLWDRANVLLDSLAVSTQIYLKTNDVLELGMLPMQIRAVPEASYVTITGFGTAQNSTNDYVWASNDPDILSKIDTEEFYPGVSRLNDNVQAFIDFEENRLNRIAYSALNVMVKRNTQLQAEADIFAGRNDKAAQERLAKIRVTMNEIEAEISYYLAMLCSQVYSFPEFNINILKQKNIVYTLYKPVMFSENGSNVFVRGWIRFEISSASVVEAVKKEGSTTLIIIPLIALIAIVIGAVGAFVFAFLIILPIRSLVRHVEYIRDTEDKSMLDGRDIIANSHDEIGILGNTINEMAHGLVKAARASKDLLIGKEIQKQFIPLEIDKDGNKLTTGSLETEHADFFGYYEGAKGVSGDYFDYRDLDGRFFAVMKCDVAGKGIPAALIMIQIATMYINYFRRWHIKTKGVHLEDLVYQINDFIEQLGFKGRFAAFTLCLFDTETGLVHFCNAGDNLVRYYDASEHKLKVISLPQTPAVGALPNSVIPFGCGYSVQSLQLDPDDVLLLYTDGIEEAKRKFRNSSFTEIVCGEGGAPPGTVHGNHVVGQDTEELGAERVEEIVNAVMNKREYILSKHHNPLGDMQYRFDFTSCTGSVEDVIMALVSVEKVFRLCKDPRAGRSSRVMADKKVDQFLKKHFTGYSSYLLNSEVAIDNPSYVYYSSLTEDEQYDDLTILGIKRK
ncbi:MAG: SpoIIE family protein phosphatase [Spirochaetaceae bacterium]|jgi:serine phosphatase RsbU (regulator of sigma subunit)/flagellar basal body-associated protein FliL|nr:SpoIIE family protein phosphatase [Spirochaetaceae bacterium]